jgi:hypothetical protein
MARRQSSVSPTARASAHFAKLPRVVYVAKESQ